METITKDKSVKRKNKFLKRILKGVTVATCTFFIGGVGAVGYGYYKYGSKIQETMSRGYETSSKAVASDFNNRQHTQFLDGEGNLLREFKSNDYYYTELKDMNPFVSKALVAIEDERFYKHKGIDYEGLMRSAYLLVKSGGKTVHGGSTITQQLSRNVYLTLDRNMWRKVEEMVIATELEKKFDKDKIIEFYVNNVNYGNGCYSFESASKYYFQKTSKDLTIGEVALITGIPNNPSIYNPIKNPQNAIDKRNIILKKMLELGYISQEEHDKANAEELKLNVQPNEKSEPIDYAMSYAIYNATKILMEQEGFIFRYSFDSDKEREEYYNKYNDLYLEKEKQLLSGGYKVETSIDMKKQEKLQQIVDEQMAQFKTKDSETGLYEKQSAVTTVDNNTGEVVAIVGGRSQEGNTFNRAYLGARQPGSTIKPIVAYAPAFERGYIPSSKYNDAEIKNGPKNYDGAYRGLVQLRYATEISINSVPFRLVNEMGADNVCQYLSNMEFRYLTQQDRNPIIAVGGFTKGITTVELASAYSTLSRNGEFIRPTNVRKITTQSTKQVIFENKKDLIKIYDSGASYLTTDTLKGVLNEPHGTGYRARLRNYPYQAGKTGTTDQNKDAWFAGYTPYYTTVAWVGNDMPEPQSVSGGGIPGQIWKSYMEYLHEGLEKKDFVKPDTAFEKNGVLVNTIYVELQKDKERKESEKRRVDRENREQLQRLNKEDYRIKYGLTKEQEEAYEKSAEEAVSLLEKFKLTDKNQYSQIEALMEKAYKSIIDVKHQEAYNQFRQRIEKAIDLLNRVKVQLETVKIEPPVDENKEEDGTKPPVGNGGTPTPTPEPTPETPKPNNPEKPSNKNTTPKQ